MYRLGLTVVKVRSQNYALCTKLWPVIDFGCSMPAKSNNVGAISHSLPASKVAVFSVSLIKIKGTKFVVCAV